jgi:cytochrome bd ubiquinol oxidase subunit I
MAWDSVLLSPAGFVIANGKFQAADWTAAIFNHSFPYRFAHMVTAAYGDTFVVIGGLGFCLCDGVDIGNSR